MPHNTSGGGGLHSFTVMPQKMPTTQLTVTPDVWSILTLGSGIKTGGSEPGVTKHS